MQDYVDYDAVELATWVRRGDITPLELVEAAVARIEMLNPELNALAHFRFEEARSQAQEMLGTNAGPFAGVPCLLKDLLPYPGLGCSMGSRLFARYVPEEPNPYCTRMDEAGFLVLGSTTTSEFGLLGSTESLLHGVTHNPWSLRHSALGSSGGAAAAVASGMVPLAHASDGGGSIRLPAAACGLFGFKPSAGCVVPAGPVHPLFAPLLAEHCVSRTVQDSAHFLSWMRNDSCAPVENPVSRSLRIGVYTQTLMGEQPHAEVLEALQRTVSLCQDLGHLVVEVEAPALDGRALSDAFFVLAGAAQAGMLATMEGLLGRSVERHELEPFTWALVEHFRGQPEDTVMHQLASMEAAKHTMLLHMKAFDVLLCPTSPILTPELGFLSPELPYDDLIRRTEQLAGYTPIHNMVGCPAMSVPLWQSQEGLPIGMHFASLPGHDDLLLALAFQLEEAAPWPKMPELFLRS